MLFNIDNKAIFGLPEMDTYDITRYKWTGFYQDLEDAVYTFGLKSEVLIVTSRYANNVPTEVNGIIL